MNNSRQKHVAIKKGHSVFSRHPIYGAYVRTTASGRGYAHTYTRMPAFPCPYVHSFKHTSTSLYGIARTAGRGAREGDATTRCLKGGGGEPRVGKIS